MNMKSKKGTTRPPQWVGFTAIVAMTFMLALVINFRAYSAMSRESAEHDGLNQQVESLTTENLALQDEIHGLKSSPKAIESEARKMGLQPPSGK